MTAKQYLRQLERINHIINSKQLQLDELRVIGSGFKAIDYAAVKVQSSPSDRMAALMAKWIDLEDEINNIIDEYVDAKNRIIAEISQLRDVRYVEILHMRYVEFKPLTDIANEMKYEYKYTCRLHGRALKAFERTVLSGRTKTN